MDAAPEPVLESFRSLFAERTGIRLRRGDKPRIGEFLHQRIRATTARDGQAYLDLLKGNSPRARNEWHTLITELTVLESYFFRDEGQFRVLRQHLLPRLIHDRRDVGELRVWSAGCSRGEEIYSIAILLDELLPDREAWKLRLVGTDINPAAIDLARRGSFSRWSLRNLDEHTRARYFHRSGNRWQLDSRITDMVDFQPGNLLADRFPRQHGPLHDMDLILCRNVFIYMDTASVARIVGKMTRTLRTGGALMTGHSELHGVDTQGLISEHLPGATIHYRLPGTKVSGTTRLPPLQVPITRTAPADKRRSAQPVAPSPTSPVTRLEEARQRFAAGEYRRALEILHRLPASTRNDPESMHLEAWALLQTGDTDAARRTVETLLAREGKTAADLFLLGVIQEAQGLVDAAVGTLQRALYLDPDLIAAYLHLVLLREANDEPDKAHHLRTAALNRLRRMPVNREIPYFEGRTAADLVAELEEAPETIPTTRRTSRRA